jgi:hypothetical protein
MKDEVERISKKKFVAPIEVISKNFRGYAELYDKSPQI